MESAHMLRNPSAGRKEDSMRLSLTSGLCFILVFSLSAVQSSSQEDEAAPPGGRTDAARVYVDCDECDMDFIKTEITFVNYVRDPKEAQVYILVTTEWTASGGTEYTITFTGREDFQGLGDTLKYVSRRSDSDDDVRKGITQLLKMGLIRYVSRTPLAEDISVSYRRESEPTVLKDPWDNWIFSASLDANFEGEKSYNETWFGLSLSAKKVTPDTKVRLSFWGTYDEETFDVGEEQVLSTSRYVSFSGTVVKSLGEHWSAGGKFYSYSNTYSNISLSVSAGPAIEYNLFPYSDCTRRELRLLYRLAPREVHYYEETIYNRIFERLLLQSLTVALDLKYGWGSTYSELYGSNYLHDFRKNHLTLYNRLSLRIVEGLSLHLHGNIQMIHDQLSIVKGDASVEDIYLRRTQLETQYSYWTSVGFSYTFGSIYSNVVNPRFGE
jgi:hypothetical protein